MDAGQRSTGFVRRKPQKDSSLFPTWWRSSVRCFGSTMLLRRKMSSFSSPSTALVASSKSSTSPSSLPSHPRKPEYVHYQHICIYIYMIFIIYRSYLMIILVQMLTVKLLLLMNFGGFCFILLLCQFLAKGTTRAKIIGGICVGFSVCVFAAPLSIIVSSSV